MIKTEPYKYKLRPGYKSEELLIEIFSGVENKEFKNDFLSAINDINPELIKMDDVWMNDEILYQYNANIGEFALSMNIWNDAFITSEMNQNVIIAIEQLLKKNPKFEKIDVDFDDYA